jgi:hypothetical protein
MKGFIMNQLLVNYTQATMEDVRNINQLLQHRSTSSENYSNDHYYYDVMEMSLDVWYISPDGTTASMLVIDEYDYRGNWHTVVSLDLRSKTIAPAPVSAPVRVEGEVVIHIDLDAPKKVDTTEDDDRVFISF